MLHTVAASSNRDHASQPLCTFAGHCLQSFTRWYRQRLHAGTTVTLLLLVRATYIMVLFFAHIPLVVNYTINPTPAARLQQHPLFFTTNHTDRTFFVWKMHLARHSHPVHSTILLRSESSARSFAPWQQATTEITWHDHSVIACSRHIYLVLFFAHIPFVVNHTFNATPPERLQQYVLSECDVFFVGVQHLAFTNLVCVQNQAFVAVKLQYFCCVRI